MARPRIGLALGSGSVRLLRHTGHCPGRRRLQSYRAPPQTPPALRLLSDWYKPLPPRAPYKVLRQASNTR
jgi:hypothetical protein